MKYLKLFSTMLLSLALALQASAYTVTTVDGVPEWQIDWSYNQERPDWQEPASENFENWTVMLVTIEEALQPYVSENDMMAVFVDGEVRSTAQPSVNMNSGEVDATHFLLKIYGNESYGDEVLITLSYYNAQLGQVFSLSVTMKLDEELMYGIDEDFIPSFRLGSPKFPLKTTLDVMSFIAGTDITPADGDMAAAFVGDECRGVCSVADGLTFEVFLREADETVVLKYYDSTNNCIFTFGNAEEYLAGDATGDGIVDVSDYIGIANYILGNTPEDFNEKAADVNGDGIVDVSDYIGVANLILYGNVNGQ